MSSSNSPTWQLSRLRRDTVDRLKQLGKRLDKARDKGYLTEEPGEQGWTVNQLVEYLLNQDDDHLERGKRASVRRRERQAVAASKQPGRSEGQ